jgi:MATE family multidrug resistance protein
MHGATLDYETPADLKPVSPLRELLGLAVPTVLQLASYTVMQFIDTWMLAKAVGAVAPAAASQAGGLSFAFMSFGFGTVMVVNTLVSQSYGQKNYSHCGRYLWQGIWFAIAYGLLILPLMWVLPHWYAAFGHEADMVAMETIYTRVMFATAGIKLVQVAFSQYMLGTNRPNVVLLSSVIAVSVNALAAYAMLFGLWGIQPMGVAGAAYAQAIGVSVEMLTLVVFSLWNPQLRAKYNALDWRPRAKELKTLTQVGFGSGLQFFAEVTAWSLFANWVFGALGRTAMEANAFMFRYLASTFMPAFGLSSAVTALVGRYIGMGRLDLALQRAHLGFKVSLVWLVGCGLVTYLFRRELIGVFTQDAEIIRLGAMLMIIAAFYELFDGMYIIYYGALRGAGDTFVPAVATAGLCWTIMLFGGYGVARFMPQWAVAGPWGIASVYGVILGFFMFFRFQRGKWKSIHLEAQSAAAEMNSNVENGSSTLAVTGSTS